MDYSVNCCEWNICPASKNKDRIPSISLGFPIEIMNLKAFKTQYEIDFLESRELNRNQHSPTLSALDHSDH